MRQQSTFYLLLASWLICSCANLPLKQTILKEVYKNENDLLHVTNDEAKRNLALLTRKWPFRITKKKQKDVTDYIAYVETQKRINTLKPPPCKLNDILIKPLPDDERVADIKLDTPSSPAMRTQVAIANQNNQQLNQKRNDEIHYRNLQLEIETQSNAQTELKKCKADSIATSLEVRKMELDNYLMLQLSGNKLKRDFAHANRELLNQNF